MTENQIELYPTQAAFLQSKASTNFFCAGRGSAKSSSIGLKIVQIISEMPRAKGFLAAATYNIILTKTLPPVIKILEICGFYKDIHFVIGKRPPKDFDTPHSPPEKFGNTITFYCGFTIELISLDRYQNARGGSYDFGHIDEIGGLSEDAYAEVLIPSLRDNEHVIKSLYHHQLSAYTSVPWVSKGWWIFKKEEAAKAEELYRSKHKITTQQNFAWFEATAHDNPFISQKVIDRWEREMPYQKFQIEVLNMRIRKAELPFFNKFDDSKHLFTPTYDVIYSNLYQYGASIRGYAQYNLNAPLDFTMDFGGHINVGIVIQRKFNTEYVLCQFYKLNENSLRDMVLEFCNKYKDHLARTVFLYGEPRGHDKRPEGKRLYEYVTDILKENGWTVVVKVAAGYRTEDHIEVREAINRILEEAETKYPKIRINNEDCKDVIISIQTAASKPDGRMDKSAEGRPNFPQQEATHFADAFKYFFIQKYHKPKPKTKRRPMTATT